MLGRVAGIPIVVHPTFLLLLAWVILSQALSGKGGVLAEAVLVCSLFVCVVLHELSHALTARRFGIRTRKITLLPIGGVAQLEHLPEKPAQELLVALAGPVMSLAIAGALFGVQRALGRPVGFEQLDAKNGPVLSQLMWLNLFLAIFNLLPAFPMDGGRVFRALLGMRLDREHATRAAARVGQAMAILFGFVGLLMNPMLVLIAVFIWFGAKSEATLMEVKATLSGVPVERAMITSFHSLDAEAPLQAAVDLTFLGLQHDFPVLEQGRAVGVLTRANVMNGLASHQLQVPVGQLMERSFETVEPWETLDLALERLQRSSVPALLVLRRGRVVGLLTAEHLSEALTLGRALQRSHSAPVAT